MNLRGFVPHGYEDFPVEIQQKMRNLCVLGIIAALFFGFMLVRAIWFEFNAYIIAASVLAFTLIIASYSLIRLKRPVAAGNAAICMLFYIFINNVVKDLLGHYARQISRINDVAVEIVFGLMVTTLFAIRRGQYLFAGFAGYSILVSSFLVITLRFYGGDFSLGNVLSLVESSILVLGSFLIALSVLSLTTQRRGEVFSNVLFYKFANAGPTLVHAEHPFPAEEEVTTGAYVYTLIGQGNKYPAGLFGPLPFGRGEANQVALVYAARIKDQQAEDPRMNMENYVIILLITAPAKVSLIDRTRLEKQLAQLTREIPDLSLLSAGHYDAMVVRIRAF